MMQYYLPRHVHFCRRGDCFVFIDLRRDDYILINGTAASALRALSSAEASSPWNDEFAHSLRQLVSDGLLTTDPTCGRALAATRVDVALEHLIDQEAPPDPRLTPRDVLRFLAASIATSVRLRWSSLETTVGRIEMRKTHHPTLDVETARLVTAKFQVLRSFFPRDYLCLYDSLALLEFLARYDVFPSWIFGVRLEPWAAHCWVQQGQFVFNEDVETAAGYAPIMAI